MSLIFILPVLLMMVYAHVVYKHPSPASYKILYITPYAAWFVLVYGRYVYFGINDGGYDTSYSILGTYIGGAAFEFAIGVPICLFCNACAKLYISVLELIKYKKLHK